MPNSNRVLGNMDKKLGKIGKKPKQAEYYGAAKKMMEDPPVPKPKMRGRSLTKRAVPSSRGPY